MSAVRITRFRIRPELGDHSANRWAAYCRRCGLRFGTAPEKRRLKREAEAALANHHCRR